MQHGLQMHLHSCISSHKKVCNVKRKILSHGKNTLRRPFHVIRVATPIFSKKINFKVHHIFYTKILVSSLKKIALIKPSELDKKA